MSDKLRDEVEKFMEYGIYLSTRTLTIDPEDDIEKECEGEISQKCAINTVKKIHILDNYNEGTINIILNNPGGSVADGFAIYDAIRACKNYVRCYVYGVAESMASIILQAADERVISENSRIMIHDGTVGYKDASPRSVENWQEYNKKVDEICYNIYLDKIREKHPKYRKQDLKRQMKDDTIFHGQEAIDIGLADRLVKRGE